MSQQVPLPTTVAQVEALAARRAVEFALEIGITNVVIEGNSKSIYRELQDPSPSLALHGHLIQDAKFCPILFNWLIFLMYAVKETLLLTL